MVQFTHKMTDDRQTKAKLTKIANSLTSKLEQEAIERANRLSSKPGNLSGLESP